MMIPHNTMFFEGLFYGALLIMILYNLFLFFSIRKQGYLFYIISIVGLLIYQMARTGFGAAYLWPENPEINYYLINLSMQTILIPSILYTGTFLKTKQYSPVLNKVLNIALMIHTLLIPLIFLLNYHHSAIIVIVITVISYLILFFTEVWIYLKGYQVARFYIISWTALLIFIIFLTLELFGFTTSGFVTQYGYELGVMWQILFFALAITDHINLLHGNVEKAHKELLQEQNINDKLFQYSPAYMIAGTATGKLVMVNQSFLTATGYQSDEVIDHHYLEQFIPKEEQKHFNAVFHALNKNQTHLVHEGSLLLKDGTKRTVQ